MTNEPKPNLKPWEVERDETTKSYIKEYGYADPEWEPHIQSNENAVHAHKSGYNAAVERMLVDIQILASAIKRRMSSDDACGHPFDENFGEALNVIEQKYGAK